MNKKFTGKLKEKQGEEVTLSHFKHNGKFY